MLAAVSHPNIAAIYGLVFSLLDRTWDPLSVTGLWLFLTMAVAFGVVGIADDLACWTVARRWGVATDLDLRPGNLLAAVTSTFASKWLIPRLPDFTRVNPDTDLRIMATERLVSFHGDGADLAVRFGKPPFGASLRADLLLRNEVVAVCAPALLRGDRPRDAAAPAPADETLGNLFLPPRRVAEICALASGCF